MGECPAGEFSGGELWGFVWGNFVWVIFSNNLFTNIRLGDHSFDAGPRVWNSLATQLQESVITLGQFQRALRMHIFRQ